MCRALLMITLLGLAALAVACQGEGGPEPSPTAPPAASPEVTSPPATEGATAEASPSPEPTPEPAVAMDQPKLIFVRPVLNKPQNESPQIGVLWMSNLDGSDQQQLTPDGVDAMYSGLVADPRSSALTLYYVARQDQYQYTIWRLNFTTGDQSPILTFEREGLEDSAAAVSPDGRYLAFIHTDGTDLLDLTTEERRRLLDGTVRCLTTGPCHGYAPDSWSPDSSLLMTREFQIEGGVIGIVDPFVDSPEFVSTGGGSNGEWSPLGDIVCTAGLYGQPSGLLLSHAPTWQDTRDALEGNPQFDTSIAYIDQCEWLGGGRIAFSSQDGFGGPSGVFTYDLGTGEVAQVYLVGDSCHHIVALPSGDSVVYQPCTIRQLDTRPEIVSLDDGTHTPILQPGDWVLDAIAPTP